MTWTEKDLRTLHAEHLAGTGVNALAKRFSRPNHNLIIAWARMGLFQTKPAARKTRRHALSDDFLMRLHSAWMEGESLRSISRRTGISAPGLPCAFAIRGLPLKPAENNGRMRTSKGTFSAAATLSKAEIAAAIARVRKFMIPPELAIHWKRWSLARRGEIVAALRARFSDPNDRPDTPFSANIIPFDYASPAVHAIASAANAGRPSRGRIVDLKINSQGVIWDGKLWFWVRKSRTYIEGIRWCPVRGRKILSRTIWEAAAGTPIPAGMVVSMKDRNPNNLAPENLYLKSRDELSRENQTAHLTRKSRQLTTALLSLHQNSSSSHATDRHILSQVSNRRH